MVYETFETLIAAELQNRLGDDYQLIPQTASKNNGLLLRGLCVRRKGDFAAPTIYLDNCFTCYQQGTSLEFLVNEILRVYYENINLLRKDYSILNDFSQLKDKVAYKLIHTRSNQELLADIPSIPYMDLSIVFYLRLEKNEHEQITCPIHNHNLEQWNTSAEELYRLACANTPRMFPPEVQSMALLMAELVCQQENLQATEELVARILSAPGVTPLFVLTNNTGVNGACTILYPNALKNFAQLLNQDLIILPSSIHEVLLMPMDDEANLEELSSIVALINRSEVPVQDRLSNHVYFYSRQTDSVHMVQGSETSPLS